MLVSSGFPDKSVRRSQRGRGRTLDSAASFSSTDNSAYDAFGRNPVYFAARTRSDVRRTTITLVAAIVLRPISRLRRFGWVSSVKSGRAKNQVCAVYWRQNFSGIFSEKVLGSVTELTEILGTLITRRNWLATKTNGGSRDSWPAAHGTDERTPGPSRCVHRRLLPLRRRSKCLYWIIYVCVYDNCFRKRSY